jgi:hypothetical protein
MKTLKEVLPMIEKAGREAYGDVYLSYATGSVFVRTTREEYIQGILDEQLVDSGISREEFMNEPFANDAMGIQGIAHAVDADGNWLTIGSLNEVLAEFPSPFYLAVRDDGCRALGTEIEEYGTPAEDGGDYYSTIYEIV